jgi:8-oxo-dGTP diphosphatase
VSAPRQTAPRIVLVGHERGQEPVVEVVLGHGEDPIDVLGARGWAVVRALATESVAGDEHVLTVRFDVRRRAESGPGAEPAPGAQPSPVPGAGRDAEPSRDLDAGGGTRRDEGLVLGPGEEPQPYQRVAAYAVVSSARGVLMTELSDRTNAPGQWGLPGGGIDPGEDPLDAVVRECWEESGQRVTVTELALVQTSHWVGRAPGGRVEDFHAVRIVYRATCPAPTEPVVHDVGGTTADARWVQPAELAALPLTPGWRAVLASLSLLPRHADETG